MAFTDSIAGIKANELPRNTGTFLFVSMWKRRVPTPAEKSATEISKPVRNGTKTVAPNNGEGVLKTEQKTFWPVQFHDFSSLMPSSLTRLN